MEKCANNETILIFQDEQQKRYRSPEHRDLTERFTVHKNMINRLIEYISNEAAREYDDDNCSTARVKRFRHTSIAYF